MVQANTTTGLIKHDKKHRLKQRFEVKHKLGQGTYGKVQLAINKETGQEVAIKTIKKSKIQSEQDLVRIRREIQIMSSIQHPHIIHIYEVFENKEKIVLVMQYASGGELYEYVSDRKLLSDNEARRLFRQIATAVYYCHKNKVCHRDLKLENILLDHNGNAKIADFGLSNVFDEKHFLNTFCGSPLYASPEIVKGIPYYGAEVDCWSLGVLLYTLVYGAMPFDGSNFKRLVKQISESSYYEPKQKSEASGLIRRLLAVDPTKRATIIDICTDWWVNKGYEHSLLQVAEDLANLTPVRLDVLLALAPTSPVNESDRQTQHPLAKKRAESGDRNKQKRSEEALYPPANDCQADTSELSTDIPTYAEEEEELADASEIIDDGDEFLPSAVAAALQDEYQEVINKQGETCGTPLTEDNEPGKSTKRIAGSSFDSSVSRVPSHVMKRKKSKKGSDVTANVSEDRQPSTSGYISDGTSVTGGTFPNSQMVTDDLPYEIDQTLTTEGGQHETKNEAQESEVLLNKIDSLPDETISISSQISSFPETSNSKTETQSISHTQSSASIETITAKDSQTTPSESVTSTLIDESCSQLPRQKSTSTTSVKSKSKSASPKRPTSSKTSVGSFSSVSSSSSTVITNKPTTSSSTVSSKVSDKRVKPTEKSQKKAKESPPKGVKEKEEDVSNASTTTITKDSPISTFSPSASASEAGESQPTTPDADKTKPWLERRSSVNRKVGKISYPKFLENTAPPEKKPVPTYGKISTAKKLFETRRSSIDKDKERVIPMVKVSDAKQAFERRASMPATQAPLWKNAGERKGSLLTQSSLDETSSRMLPKEKSSTDSKSSTVTRPKKSSSSPDKRRSPNKSPVKKESDKTVTKSSDVKSEPSKDDVKTEVKEKSPTKSKVKSTSQIVINSANKQSDSKVVKTKPETKSEQTEVKLETKPEDQSIQPKESRSVGGEDETVSKLSESPSIINNSEDRKLVAKDIIKKQIAKAKLQELRQSSIESHESNLSVSDQIKLPCQGASDESSTSSTASASKPKSYVKAPQPFIKEEIKPTPVRSVAEIKLSPKPKLGLDIEAAHRGQPKQQKEIEEVTPTNIIEPPSTAGTQNQESNPGTPSTALSKAAPITRSYKKVIFTKDGACITETGKIIAEEGADGSFSRIEKKSKVTHYPVGASGGGSARSESSEETRTIKNFGDSIDEGRTNSVSPPIIRQIPDLRRSESASSSGSTDIFDDIFDTWSGDPVFSNLSGRMRSMLSQSRSPFSSLWGTGRKKSKQKSRAESAERKPKTELDGGWRRAPGHGTDQEFSDTDTDTEPSMGFGGGGLWKFLGSNPSSSNLLDRHRSLLSKHFGSDDFFSDAEPFSSSFRRSLSRDRGSTSFGTARQSTTPTVRMVINPLHNRSSANRMTTTPSKQDSLDSNESGGSNAQHATSTSFSSKPVTGRPYSRTISRESQRRREGGNDSVGGASGSFDMDESGPSSRRRVEQWLDMSRDDEDIGQNHPISMYTTIRPRPINRYGRSVSSRFGFDLGSVDSNRILDPPSGSNLSFNTTQEIHIGSPNVSEANRFIGNDTVTSKPRSEVIIPVGRNTSPSIATSSSNKPMITMKLSLGGETEPKELRTYISSAGGGGGRVGLSSSGIIETPGSADLDDWSSPVLLPENSSLLDQLRTHGYRNLVSQRLSGLSGTSGGGEPRYDNRDNSSTTTTTTTSTTTTTTTSLPPQQMKRGKSLTGDSSSLRDLENLINNDGEIAWNPVNGQSIKSNNSMFESMESTTNHETSLNRIDRVAKKPVDRDGVINSWVQQKQFNLANNIIGDGNGNGDGQETTRGDEGSLNNRVNSKSKTNNNIEINNSNQNESFKDDVNRNLAANKANYNTKTSYFSSSTTLTSLPPKPRSFIIKNNRNEDNFDSKLNEKQDIEYENRDEYQNHRRPNLNHHRNQHLAPFHLHQQSNFDCGPENTSTPPQPCLNRQQVNESKTFNQLSKDTCNDINKKNVKTDDVDNNDDTSTSHRSLINNANTNINATSNDPNHKETLQERILRKSYYSRFNHPLERRSSSVRRRTSLIENNDRLFDFSFLDNPHSSRLQPSTANSGHSHHPDLQSFDSHGYHNHSKQQNHHPKPPFFLTNDQFIERVQIRAQQLIEEARERRDRINSKLMSSFRPITLNLHHDNNDFFGHTNHHNNPHLSFQRSREPSPMFLRRTGSFSGPEDPYFKSRKPSASSTSSSSTATNRSFATGTSNESNRKSSSYQTARTSSTRLTNGNSQDLDDDLMENGDDNQFDKNDDDDLGDDLTSRAQVISEALKILKERALQDN